MGKGDLCRPGEPQARQEVDSVFEVSTPQGTDYALKSTKTASSECVWIDNHRIKLEHLLFWQLKMLDAPYKMQLVQ